jgi:hypothetical protein
MSFATLNTRPLVWADCMTFPFTRVMRLSASGEPSHPWSQALLRYRLRPLAAAGFDR